MRKLFGILLILIGALLLCAALAVTGRNIWQEERSDAGILQAMDQLRQQLPDPTEPTPEAQPEAPTLPGVEISPQEDALRPMPEVIIDGVGYVGYLSIPKLKLELPVIGESSEENLELAPCRFYGTAYQKDFVIGGHRYRRHFRKLSTLGYGEIIRFTDMDGNEFTYEVTELEVIEPYEAQYLCSGDWDLSLFTCTVGGKLRVTVRCELTWEEPNLSDPLS